MKFDELCEVVLIGEADYDAISGKDKVFSLADDAEEKVLSLDLNNVKELIRKTTLPFTKEYLSALVIDDLSDYLPAETQDLKKMLKRNVWAKFDDTEKKSTRAANILFAFLKKKKIFTPGINKSEVDEGELDRLSKELERDVGENDYSDGMSLGDVEKYGGRVPGSRGHAEDESIWS
jgi:hypothetical protein